MDNRGEYTDNRYRRGDIVWVNLPNNRDNIQGGVRPVVIVSNNICNNNSPVLHGIPLTRQIKKHNQPTQVIIPKNSAIDESVAMAEQLMPINKTWIKDKIAKCGDKLIEKINIAILVQVGLN